MGAAGTEAAGITAGAAPGMPDAATATGVGAATGTILSHVFFSESFTPSSSYLNSVRSDSDTALTSSNTCSTFIPYTSYPSYFFNNSVALCPPNPREFVST